MALTSKPVLIASGTKVLPEVDFLVPPEDFPLKLGRAYSKDLTRAGAFGMRWSSNIEHTLSFEYGTVMCNGRLDQAATCSPGSNPLSAIYANGESGFASKHTSAGNGQWTNADGTTIVQSGSQWVMTGPDGDQEIYDAYGRPITIKNERGIGLTYIYSSNKLATITHTTGRSISITWSGSKISAVTAPNGKAYGYGYNANGYLASVVYPDNLGTRTYHYEDTAQPGGLTGISINGVRYSRYKYLANGKVEWSGLEGGVERSSFVYGANYTEVTNVAGHKTHYEYAQIGGKRQLIWIERDATSTCAGSLASTTYDANGNRDLETDQFGVMKDYDYDADGRLMQEVSGIGKNGETDQQQITQYIWDATRKTRLNQIKVFGASTSQPLNTTTYTYYPDGDPRARLLQSVAVANQSGGPVGTLTTTYDYTVHPNGIIATMTVDGPLAGTGDAVVSTYDTAGNLLTVKNSLGHTTTYASYNALGQPGKITSANGAVTQYTYNARGQVLAEKRTVDGVVQITTTVYDTRGRPILVTTPDGVATRYAYDNYDRLIETSRDESHSAYAAGGSSAGLMAGGLQRPKTNRIRNCEPTDPDCFPDTTPPPPSPTNNAAFMGQSVPTTMVTGRSYPVSVTMRNSGTTTWSSASSYNLGSVNPLDNYRWGMHRVGLPASIAPGQSAVFSFNVTAPATPGSYSFQWRMVQDGVQWFGAQSSNVTVSVLEPPPPPIAFTQYRYNLLSQLTQVQSGVRYPPGTDTSGMPTLRKNGPVMRMSPCMSHPTDPECEEEPPPETPWTIEIQSTVTIEYDAGGFVSARRGGNGQIVTYHYNANGDVDWQKDALGNTTYFGYDRQRRVNRVTDAAGGVTTTGYNALGLTAWVSDPRGLVTSYTYDGLGNLLGQSSPDTGTTSFWYNAQGQRTQALRADATALNYTYDTLGRLKTQSSGGQTRTLTYDSCTKGKGLLCKAAKTGGTAATASFTYTAWGQVATRQDVLGSVTDTTSYSYDGMGRLTGIGYPSGVAVGYGYLQGHLRAITATVNGAVTTVGMLDAYRADGTPTELLYGNGLRRRSNFDASGRLAGISTNDAGGPLQSLTYGFDAADRITAITNGVEASQTQQYQYDGLSRLTRAAMAGGNVAIYGYDAAGNRTMANTTSPSATTGYTIAATSNRMAKAVTGSLTRTFTYNANGDITAFTDAAGVTNTLAYDPFGRLASHGKSGITTSYTVNALDQRMAKSSTGTSSRYAYAGFNQLLAENTNGAWTSYVWNGNEPVALVRNNQIYYIHNDHLGRPQLTTRSDKSVAWKASNQAFDRSVTQGASDALGLGFPGQYQDMESGLWHNGYREYLADAGRYLQSDPIGLAGGVNTYAYVGGNPVNLVDPLGLCEEHKYEDKTLSPCSPTAAFNALKQPNMSAPGAPAAREGLTTPVVLWGNGGNNRISQYVNSETRTIVNTTLEGHQFYPGTVTWQVTSGPGGYGSMITVTGTGSGPNPIWNDIVGLAYFPNTAALAAVLCMFDGK